MGSTLQVTSIWNVRAFLSPLLKIVKMTGKIDAKQYHRILNEYLIAFFRKYLYAVPSGLLDDQENKYKDVELKTRNVETQ